MEAMDGGLAITELKIHQHWIAVGTQNGHIFVFDHFQVVDGFSCEALGLSELEVG